MIISREQEQILETPQKIMKTLAAIFILSVWILALAYAGAQILFKNIRLRFTKVL